MREIVQVQVGQCGNQIGCAFWESVAKEHYLDFEGKFDKEDADKEGVNGAQVLEKVGVYFTEVKNSEDEDVTRSKYVPRAVIVDLEPGVIDDIQGSALGNLFRPGNIVAGASGAGNNWAKGHYTEGAELVEDVIEIVRREVEGCESLQGFQLTHSLGGGTGSGMGTLLSLKLRDNFPDRLLATYSVYPSPRVSDTVVEPYNAVLSSHQLLENADETFMVDNEALYSIAQTALKEDNPSYAQLNNLISQCMCGVTASLRFPGQLNGDLRKLGVNLVPFPRLHFFLLSQAPLITDLMLKHVHLDVKELTRQVWSEKNFFCQVKLADGKVLANSVTYRGPNIESSLVDECTAKKQQCDYFVEYIPNNIKTAIVNVAPRTSSCSATFVGNHTGLKDVYKRMLAQFGAMYKRKAFLHWYKGEGMDECEFQEADANIRDLVVEYEDKESAVTEEEEEEDDSGE